MNTSRPVVKTDPEVCGVLEPLVDGVGNDIHASYQYGGAFGRASDDDDGDERENWISWFCSLKGHDWFAEIEEEYIRDSFNLYGLKGVVNNFERALEMILGDAPGDRDLMEKRFFDLYKDAVDLYGLIHARYIISPRGLSQMVRSLSCGSLQIAVSRASLYLSNSLALVGAFFRFKIPYWRRCCLLSPASRIRMFACNRRIDGWRLCLVTAHESFAINTVCFLLVSQRT